MIEMKFKQLLSIVGFCCLLIVGLSIEAGGLETLYRDTPFEKFVAGGEKWFIEGDEDTQVKYLGEVRNGMPHGKGSETIKGTDYRFIGEYLNGWKIQGTVTSTDGTKYVGRLKNNKRHGQGVATYSDGSKYVGEWQNGMWNGRGSYTTSDRSKLVGEFKKNLLHGKGSFYSPDGISIVGKYRNGQPYSVTMTNTPMNFIFVGLVRDGLKLWSGTLYNNDREVVEIYYRGTKYRK